MSIELVLFILAAIGHIALFNRSGSEHKTKRLVRAFGIMTASIALCFVGLLVGLSGKDTLKELAIALLYAPAYMVPLSFLVYCFPKPGQPTQPSD